MLWCRALISTTWALTCVCARASSACVYVPTRGTCVYSVIGRTCFDAETLGFICGWWKSAAMRNYTPSWYQVPSHRFEREKKQQWDDDESVSMATLHPLFRNSVFVFCFFVFLFFVSLITSPIRPILCCAGRAISPFMANHSISHRQHIGQFQTNVSTSSDRVLQFQDAVFCNPQ